MSRSVAVAVVLLAGCIPEQGPLMRPGEDCLECHGGSGLPGEPPTVSDREGARSWTVAGTVFPSAAAAPGDGLRGAKVRIRDADGRTLTLETNLAGNFYTAERVRFPLRVSVEHALGAQEMEGDVPYGGCNGCHRLPPRQEAPGRVSIVDDGDYRGPYMMPGENCLECHGGQPLPDEPPTVPEPLEAPAWTVAGTVFSTEDATAEAGVEGASVHVTDATGFAFVLRTNRAGNFYTDLPVVFPLRVRVEYAGNDKEMEPDVPYGGCNGCHRLPPRQEAPGRIAIPGSGGD